MLFFCGSLQTQRWQKKAFLRVSETVSSRRQIKNLRALSYTNYPPGSSKSIIIIEIGEQEGTHRPFFAPIAANRFLPCS